MPRLPPLPDTAQAPGAIPEGQETLHRAAHAARFWAERPGARTAGGQRGGIAKTHDVFDRVRAARNSDAEASAVMHRVMGTPETGRQPETVHSVRTLIIAPAAERAVVHQALFDALFGPLLDVGWTDVYDAEAAATRNLLNRPLRDEDGTGALTHYAATIRLTPPQRADLDTAVASTPGVEVLTLPIDADAFQVALWDAFLARGIAPPPPPKDAIP